jgi:hypothetical protein
MYRAVLGPQAPINHAPGCPLAAWLIVDLAAKISTSYRPDGSSANLISSSSRYLARLSAKAKWLLESLGSKDLWHQSANRGLNPRSTRQRRSQACLRPSRHQRLGPLVPWSLDPLVARHQAGNDALVPRFLGLTFSREQGTVAAGYPRSPWKLGPLVPGPANDPGSIANLMTWSLDRIGKRVEQGRGALKILGADQNSCRGEGPPSGICDLL